MNITILEQKISDVRGHRVLLDADMASLYGVSTQEVKDAVTGNKIRFPKDFAFELTAAEATEIGTTVGAWAFTENGVAMLACLLNTERAQQMSVAIVRAFINMQRIAVNYTDITGRYPEVYPHDGGNDVQLPLIYATIEKLLDKKVEKQKWAERERIGFKK